VTDDELMDDEFDDVRYVTHPKAVAGIVVMASLMVFSVLFAIILILAGVLVPPSETFGMVSGVRPMESYLSGPRLLFAGGTSAALTGVFWFALPDD
jgi:hypothetical protein